MKATRHYYFANITPTLVYRVNRNTKWIQPGAVPARLSEHATRYVADFDHSTYGNKKKHGNFSKTTITSYLNPYERHPREAKRAFRQSVHANIPAIQSAEPGKKTILAGRQDGSQIADVLRRKGETVDQGDHLAKACTVEGERTAQRKLQ